MGPRAKDQSKEVSKLPPPLSPLLHISIVRDISIVKCPFFLSQCLCEPFAPVKHIPIPWCKCGERLQGLSQWFGKHPHFFFLPAGESVGIFFSKYFLPLSRWQPGCASIWKSGVALARTACLFRLDLDRAITFEPITGWIWTACVNPYLEHSSAAMLMRKSVLMLSFIGEVCSVL